MSKKKAKPNEKMQVWIDARKRYHLSHAHLQMARELGMNPKKIGTLDNHDQEPWKAPLRDFIEALYFKKFGKTQPDAIMTIEDKIRHDAGKKALKREANMQRRLNQAAEQERAEEACL